MNIVEVSYVVEHVLPAALVKTEQTVNGLSCSQGCTNVPPGCERTDLPIVSPDESLISLFVFNAKNNLNINMGTYIPITLQLYSYCGYIVTLCIKLYIKARLWVQGYICKYVTVEI